MMRYLQFRTRCGVSDLPAWQRVREYTIAWEEQPARDTLAPPAMASLNGGGKVGSMPSAAEFEVSGQVHVGSSYVVTAGKADTVATPSATVWPSDWMTRPFSELLGLGVQGWGLREVGGDVPSSLAPGDVPSTITSASSGFELPPLLPPQSSIPELLGRKTLVLDLGELLFFYEP
jgi:hypothetical protein